MSFSKLLYVLLGSVVMIFVCAWLMHNVEVANLVLIVLSIVVTIIFFRQAFKLDKTGRNKMLHPLVSVIEGSRMPHPVPHARKHVGMYVQILDGITSKL